MANVSDPQIPAALAPVVVGPVSLNNFPVKSHVLPLGSFFRSKTTGETRPLTTFPNCGPAGCFGLGPADFATIYNSAALLSGTPKIDGTGQTIAIVGESNINVADVTDFRTIFNLPQNFSASNIILNGPDPGINPSEGESDLDVQWAGAVAPGATIDFVTSEPTEATAGIFLSATYIVDNNIAGVMSESFGGCEQQIGTLNQFHNSLWEQAAAQGITVMVSSGDGGSAGCDNFDTAQTATHGLGVSGFASTAFNVAVALLATPNPEAGSPGPSLGFDPLTLTNGTGTDTNAVLPGGTYTLTAHYQGDGTFGASDSTPGISVNISAEPSKTLISIPVFDPTAGFETGNAPTSLVYGSPYIARIDVGNANASGGFPPPTLCTAPNCPTGTITWTDAVNGGAAAPLDGGSFALNSSGYAEDRPIQLSGGSHVLSASYSGDKSYGAAARPTLWP
jgi:hypothetical protein